MSIRSIHAIRAMYANACQFVQTMQFMPTHAIHATSQNAAPRSGRIERSPPQRLAKCARRKHHANTRNRCPH
eukprot:2908368-Lingulodinium_polyedra.AAC.1